MTQEPKTQATDGSDSSRCSASYAEKASELSERIERADTFFAGLEGKVEAIVTDGTFVLGYSRRKDKLWGLLVGKSQANWRSVTESSIKEKVAAAMMLPKLCDLINERTKEATRSVDDAIDVLDSLLGM